jgi:hypothetical protein
MGENGQAASFGPTYFRLNCYRQSDIPWKGDVYSRPFFGSVCPSGVIQIHQAGDGVTVGAGGQKPDDVHSRLILWKLKTLRLT